MRKILTPVLCILLAIAGVVMASEIKPYALTTRPGGEAVIRSRDPVTYQCDWPCVSWDVCDFSAGGSSTDSWNADMEYDEVHNVMWTVEVCGNYGLEAWDYGSLCQIYFDCDSVTGTCERGVAYVPIENRLYVGNWSSGVITKLDPENSCAQVGHCDLNYLGYPYYSIAGLAYDETNEVIWVVTNSDPDYLYAVYPFADGFHGNCTLAGGFYAGPMPWGCRASSYQGGGLEYDKFENRLYAQNQTNYPSGPTYTEVFDVGDGSAPAFEFGCYNADDEGYFYGWGIGKKDGSDDVWVTDINRRLAPPCSIQCQSFYP